MFDKCDVSRKGTVSYSELAGAVKALGVMIPKVEMRELMMDVFESSADKDKLSFEEFTVGIFPGPGMLLVTSRVCFKSTPIQGTFREHPALQSTNGWMLQW